MLLTIIIPVFNAEKTISRTVDSLRKLAPGSRNLSEVIFVDDGATDNSRRIIEQKKGELAPLTVIILGQRNQGSGAARNAGMDKSTGSWIFFLDADDELGFDPVPRLKNYPDASALGFPVMLMRNAKQRTVRQLPIAAESLLDIFSSRNACTISSIIFRKEMLDSLFDPGMEYLEDWLFWMMNPQLFRNMKVVKGAAVALIHAHGGNKTTNAVMNGTYREVIARRMIELKGSKLTAVQKNNFMIQAAIGRLQQGKGIPLKTFLLVPCSRMLYGKLVFYFLRRANAERVGFYGK
jgi:glycosyltransferase involved in cell wall biosynthesis